MNVILFQVISDLVHDFINFNALKIILKNHNKIIKKDPGLILTQGQSTCNLVHICKDKREIPAIVYEKIVIVLKFHTLDEGYHTCNGSEEQMNK